MSALSVLLVEDNPRNLKLARDVLEHAGFAVTTVTSGEEALPAARAAVPDVILMDLQLPGIDGLEALRQLRAGEDGRHVPVVAVTAFAMKEDHQRAADAGRDHLPQCLQAGRTESVAFVGAGKPADIERLVAQAMAFLEQQQVFAVEVAQCEAIVARGEAV